MNSSAASPLDDRPYPAAASISRGQRWLTRVAVTADLDDTAPWWRRYGTAVIAVLAALGARMLCDPLLGTRGSYGFFLVSTIYVAWRRGLGPSIATCCAGAVLGTYFFEMPQGNYPFANLSDFVPLALSLTIGFGAAFVCKLLRIMAAEYARMYREAREADLRKDNFLAMLAHELRNPLAPIRNALYLLESDESRSADAEELQTLITGQVNHLIRLVDDLLDVARIKGGRIELRPEPIDLRTVIKTSIDTARPLIDDKKHELLVQMPSTALPLDGDAVRLAQVIANLLNNAAKYTDKGGRIWLSAERDGNQIVCRVRDTGAGLTAEQMSRIFKLFEQADPSIEKSRGGLGIGLTLARMLVEMHGGTLEVTSPGLGLGSEFSIHLPMDPAVDSLVDTSPTSNRRSSRPMNRLRILIVEDLSAAAQSLAAVLRLWSHEVEVANDGFSGLERARAMLPDVILTDLGMPQMDGYHFAEEVRRLPGLNRVPLVAISGYGQAKDRQRSFEAGFERHLTKPINPDELRMVLDEIDERRTPVGAAE